MIPLGPKLNLLPQIDESCSRNQNISNYSSKTNAKRLMAIICNVIGTLQLFPMVPLRVVQMIHHSNIIYDQIQIVHLQPILVSFYVLAYFVTQFGNPSAETNRQKNWETANLSQHQMPSSMLHSH
jgi:hypothetical protein